MGFVKVTVLIQQAAICSQVIMHMQWERMRLPETIIQGTAIGGCVRPPQLRTEP